MYSHIGVKGTGGAELRFTLLLMSFTRFCLDPISRISLLEVRGGGEAPISTKDGRLPGSDDAVLVLQAAVPAGGGQETGEEGAAQTRRGELDARYINIIPSSPLNEGVYL